MWYSSLMKKDIILSLDTCCGYLSLALLNTSSGRVDSIQKNVGRELGEVLHSGLKTLCDDICITQEQIEKIVVTVGPGSFTSVRIGLTAARGLALALDVPIIGFSTLEVLYKQALSSGVVKECDSVYVAHAAHANTIFVQKFPQGEAYSCTVFELTEKLVFGDIIVGNSPFVQNWQVPEGVTWLRDEILWRVDPEFLARLGVDVNETHAAYGNKKALYVHPLNYDKVAG